MNKNALGSQSILDMAALCKDLAGDSRYKCDSLSDMEDEDDEEDGDDVSLGSSSSIS